MTDSKPSLNDLRVRLTDTQRAILSEIWKYWCEKNKIITAIGLYNTFRKAEVESSLEELGGSVAFRSGNPDTGRSYYQLTFLGVLLSDRGREAQDVMEKYLGYLHDRLKSDPELVVVTEDNLKYGAPLNKAETDLLKSVITQSPFWNGDNVAELYLRVPRNVDALALATNIHEFFEETVLQNYDPDKALDWSWLPSYAASVHTAEEVVMNFDVFLSYASADEAEAHQIYEAIQNAGGKAFLAAKSLRAGDDFAEEIRMALTESSEVWLLLSPNSLKSEWVISEWGAAWALDKRIVPILLRMAPSDVPERIRRLHCVDFHKYSELVKGGFPRKATAKGAIKSAKKSKGLKGQMEGPGSSVNGEQMAPTCPNCSTDRPVFMSPIPEDFVELENATHECPRCKFKAKHDGPWPA